MSELTDLINHIQKAIGLANQMSQDPEDNFAICSSSLQAAEAALSAEDMTTACLCPCHTMTEEWHALPCGCYSGKPLLGF